MKTPSLRMRALPLLLTAGLCVQSQTQHSPEADEQLRQYYEAGESALQAGRYSEAESAFLRLQKLSPSTAEVHGRLGLVYFQEGKFASAAAAFRQALKLKPSLPNTDLLLAMSLSEIGEYKEALPGLEKGFRRSTDQALKRSAGLHLVRTYTELRRDREAVESSLELSRLFPDDPEILYHSSRIYANFAYLTLQKLSDVAPSSVWRIQAAAEAFESAGNYELAISEYRRVLGESPYRPGIHYRIGRCLLNEAARAKQDSNGARAVAEFEAELGLDNTNANAAYESAEIHRKAGDLDKARQLFEQAISHYPDFAEAQQGLGAVLITQGKPEEAIAHLKTAATLDAANEVTFYRLALAYKSLGKAGEQASALAEYTRRRTARAAHEDTLSALAARRELTKQEIDENAPDKN